MTINIFLKLVPSNLRSLYKENGWEGDFLFIIGGKILFLHMFYELLSITSKLITREFTHRHSHTRVNPNSTVIWRCLSDFVFWMEEFLGFPSSLSKERTRGYVPKGIRLQCSILPFTNLSQRSWGRSVKWGQGVWYLRHEYYEHEWHWVRVDTEVSRRVLPLRSTKRSTT